jgi:hypothetical protein
VTISRWPRPRPAPLLPPPQANRMAYDRLVRLGGRWFAVVNDADRGLVELDDAGFVKAPWPVIANATRFYRKGALSWYLGQPYLRHTRIQGLANPPKCASCAAAAECGSRETDQAIALRVRPGRWATPCATTRARQAKVPGYRATAPDRTDAVTGSRTEGQPRFRPIAHCGSHSVRPRRRSAGRASLVSDGGGCPLSDD